LIAPAGVFRFSDLPASTWVKRMPDHHRCLSIPSPWPTLRWVP